jgi:peptidoglycan/xylan/chitin deacetylase (PgdA/CDA1 family)
MEELIEVRVQGSSEISPHLAWAQGGTFRLPASLVAKYSVSGVAAQGNLQISPVMAGEAASYGAELRLRHAFTEKGTLSCKLPFSYQIIPPRLRNLIAATLGFWRRHQVSRWAAFPHWPLDLSADFLADWGSDGPGCFATGPAPVILTHDLDSPEGLRNLVRWFLAAEEAVGARSTNFVVPCAWPLDHGLLTEVQQRGHEIGVHGYDHSNRTPFLDLQTRRRRLAEAYGRLERYGVVGYRAPSLFRTKALLEDVAELYAYDSSIPTSGGLFPVPNNGCASARPFSLAALMEVPVSLPRDGSLRFLGYAPEQVLDLWIECSRKIAASGGVVVLLSHCESRFSGNAAMLQTYSRFLEFVASSGDFAFSSMREVLHRASNFVQTGALPRPVSIERLPGSED